MIIEFDSLEIVFGTGNDALKVLDIPYWSVDEGDRVAIFGPSGSGKSTFLHALAGILPATNGKVTVCGHSLESMSEAERDRFRAQYIGYIYQNFNLLQGFTALENVLMGMTFSPRRPDPDEAEHLLNEVGLSHRLKSHPSRMSSGEQQRVAVARALANRPKILLADEPTASLHPVNKEDVLRMLLNMCDRYGCTLVLVTHEKEVISLFEKTVTFLELNRAYQSHEGR
ncbi:MAG: ABC transporter ATP-binding protein [Deltaproteobacteria bacterium]|nr:ABC transporter ATP-binding protein [Deltaproteobacteria bacterium]MBW1861958.1 ABC transporter ATP-binding protein [Deltaproteobacteria bacterium]